LPAALEAARELYAEAARYVDFADHPFDDSGLTHRFQRGGARFEDCRVVRLDLVRDFQGVARHNELLNGLAAVHQPGRAKVDRRADGDRNNAETLSIGPKAWRSTLYDKHAESHGTAPAGQLRFEARLRTAVLTGVTARRRAGAVHTLADLSEPKLAALRRWMFTRVGYDRTVSGWAELSTRVFHGNDLSARRRRELWAYLTARPYGVDLGYHRNIVRVYERIVADLGVVAPGQGFHPDAVTVRLDYDAGVEVFEAA